ncbi:DsbA family protein [Candidatus Uhrbacteria bacterium]|nr:DsbA family protein [Candidatus Uhrbacteria bacterium]
MSTQQLFAFLGSLIVILGIGGFLTFQDRILPGKNPSATSARKNASTPIDGAIQSSDAVTIGPDQATVTVVEFIDFQCPFCRAAHPTLARIMDEYKDRPVRFMFRHFPIISIHPLALPASNASLCANEQKQFLPYYDILYTRQDEISLANLVIFAESLGLNLRQFNACLAEKRYESLIRQDVRDGLNLGLEGTPTWFINDTRLVGAVPYEKLKEAIEQELKK